MLDLFAQIAPYLGYDLEMLMKPKKRKDPSRSGNPAKASGAIKPSEDLSDEDTFRLLATMRQDLDCSSMRDLVLLGPEGVRAVLALSREFLTPAAADSLLGGRFAVVGKVTRVLDEEEMINLTRRTAIGLGGPDLARQIVNAFSNVEELFVEVGEAVIEPPALQLLPLAVFV